MTGANLKRARRLCVTWTVSLCAFQAAYADPPAAGTPASAPATRRAESAPASGASVAAEIQAICEAGGSRLPGSPGNKAVEDRLARRFQETGFLTDKIAFRAPVFVPGPASITVGDGPAVSIQPLHPTLMRPGNFEQAEVKTRLVYLGRGTYTDIENAKGADLNGSVALMEFDCGDRWMDLLRFGVKGFLFIGADHYDYSDSYAKVYNTEAAVPRFFVPPAEGRKLREACGVKPPPAKPQPAPGAEATIRSSPSRWKTETLCSPWVLIPGSDPDLSKEIVLFTAPLDANSVVPQRATGAIGAGNLHLLLKLLEEYQARPPQRSVMLAAVNAHTQNYLGERVLAWHLLADPSDLEDIRYAIAREMRVMRLYSDNYSRSKLKLDPVDKQIGPEELGIWVEALWQLDAQRGGKEGEPLESLDPFGEADYRRALDAVIRKLQGESESFFRGLSKDDQALRGLQEDRKLAEKLKGLDAAEAKSRASRALSTFNDEKLLESWRGKLDGSTGIRVPIKAELQNEAKRRLNQYKMKIMGVAKAAKDDPKRQEELPGMDKVRKDMTKVLVLFNKIDIGLGRSRVRYRHIAANEDQLKILREYRDTVLKDFSSRRQALQQALDADSRNDTVRDVLRKRRVVLVLNLDLTWNSDRVGLCTVDPHCLHAWQVEFGKVVTAIAKGVDGGADFADPPFVDALTRQGGHEQAYYFQSTDSPVPYFQDAQGAPALSVKNAFANNGLAFSPDDTVERLDGDRIRRMEAWLARYFRALLDDKDVTAAKYLGKPATNVRLWSTVLRTFTLDAFSGKVVPDKPIPGCLIALYRTGAAGPPFLVNRDVVNCYSAMSDETGTTVLYGVNEGNDAPLAPIAYQLDDRFTTLLYDIDKGRVQESMQLTSNVVSQPSRTLPMFPCVEFPLYDRADPTLIGTEPITVQQVWPMSADSKASPQKYGTHGFACLSDARSHVSRGPGSVTLWKKEEEFQPDRLLVLTDWKRCALNATARQPEGEGFASPEELGPDFFAQVARDMDVMNRKRLREMKGVSNELLDDFLAAGKRSLADMARRNEALDHAGFARVAADALGSEVKAYDQIRSMNSDMLKAIVLYMALMLPFCFFLQKLLFNFTRLEHDMMAFVLMFTATYVVFRLIHPAFRIAMNPEAIFIAFVLGAVGAFVVWVLHKRFKTEMQLVFRNTTGMESSVTYSTVGQTAMMIGVNNMKRRRIRTTLTTGTIILVVFTMLAFSSVSKKMRPTLIRKADDSPYTGLFYHWPAGKYMDEETARAFETTFGGRAELLVRRVLDRAEPMLLEAGRKSRGAIDLEAVVGLPQEEDGFLGRAPLSHGRFFSGSDAREIILPGRALEALKIPFDQIGGVKLRLLGEDLTLVGVMDDDRYSLMRDLNPHFPLLPRKREKDPALQIRVQRNTALEDENLSALTVDTSALAFLPAGLAAKLGAKPFSVSVRFLEGPDGKARADLWKEVSLLLNITEAKFYVGSRQEFKPGDEAEQTLGPGIHYIGASYRTSVGGLSRLLIPLLIAGSIILNTMLGTVHERKYEIAVYNAVGLNPTHIFLFFLAEAMVYGVIGSVAGYLIGQLLAIGIKALGVVQGVNINFSSLMVGYAILFTIGLVLLSTVYPAFVATRTAVPSGKRKWSLPDHDGRRMNVAFPFIYQPNLASGVMYYLYEYFSTFTEQSIGDQIARLEARKAGTDANGRPIYELQYHISLAPFDLGVTQSVVFATRFDEIVDSYRVHMATCRLSGQDTNWVTTNRPFLEKLRKLLIRWRNLDPTQHGWYVEQSKKLFASQEEPDAAETARA